MGQTPYDAVVVGAGPAGCRTARNLALRGLHVALIEEHSGVGLPCHCSGLVTPRTIETAGTGTDLIQNAIRGAVVHLSSGTRASIGGNRIHAYVIDRVELDRRLARQALEAGAELILRTRFLDYRLTGTPRGRADAGAVISNVLREGTKTTLVSRLLVGADGARSRVAEQIRGSPPADVVIGLGAEATYGRNSLSDHVEIFLDRQAAPGWFGWTIPVGNGTARMGTGTVNDTNARVSFGMLRDRFPDSFGTAEIRAFSGGMIPIWAPTPLVADRVLLVGDAARQVKPTSGGGIHAALTAAAIASAVAADALGQSDVAMAKLRKYSRLWYGTLGRELRRQHDMRHVFHALSEREVETFVTLVVDALKDDVESRADIDFPSRIVRPIAKRALVMAIRPSRWPRYPSAWLPRILT
jgi:digeranylgeranylglycerophospholipid reductase